MPVEYSKENQTGCPIVQQRLPARAEHSALQNAVDTRSPAFSKRDVVVIRIAHHGSKRGAAVDREVVGISINTSRSDVARTNVHKGELGSGIREGLSHQQSHADQKSQSGEPEKPFHNASYLRSSYLSQYEHTRLVTIAQTWRYGR